MLTIKVLRSNSATGDGGGVPRYLTSTQYYLDKNGQEQSSAKWLGRGAASLGLHGKPVTEELMNKLAQGYAPDGTSLRQNAGAAPSVKQLRDRQGNVRLDENGKPMTKNVGVRIGFDLTFSSPKTVSVVWAGADPELRGNILEAHHRAVEAGIAFIEKHAAETRRGKGGKDVLGADIVVSRHTHFGARPHEKDWKERGDHEMDVDPQLHSHCLMYNLGRAEDGSWGSIEAKEAYRWKMAAGALYRAELASQMRKLGFGIEEDLRFGDDGQIKDRFFKIAGVPDDLADQMSGRRKEILAHMEQHGGTAQQANLATRRDKDEPSFGELINRWQEDLSEYRRQHPGLFPENVRSLIGRQPKPKLELSEEQRDREILNELHETNSVWTRADLTAAIASRATGERSMAHVLAETSNFLRRNDLALIEPEKIHADDRGAKLSRRHREVRFADPKVLAQEQEMVRAAAQRKHETAIRVSRDKLEQAVGDMERDRGFQLTQEQREAAAYACCGSGGVALIKGRAGTGKTTTAQAIVKAFREDGRQVIGAATGWDAAKKLQAESGVDESHSIASLLGKLDKDKIHLTPRSVLLVDEAGMVGTPSMKALLDHAHRAKAKVLLQGDPLQLQSVERGAPMRALEKVVGAAELKDIRRQKRTVDRETAQAFYEVGGAELRSRQQNLDAGQAILARLEARGQIVGHKSREDAMKALVQDYLTSPRSDREKLIIGGTRSDVTAINTAIREHRKSTGELGTEFQVKASQPRTGQVFDLPLCEGDQIRFTKRNEELGLVNGIKASICKLHAEGEGHFKVRVRIESDIQKQDGRIVEFSTREFGCMTHAYASTVHKSQGQSVAEVYHLGHAGMTDRQLALVSFTRMKEAYTVYGDAAELYDTQLDAKTAEDRLQVNAMEEGLAFGGRTTKQVIADLKSQKALEAHEAMLAERQKQQPTPTMQTSRAPEREQPTLLERKVEPRKQKAPVAQPAKAGREAIKPSKPVALDTQQKALAKRAADAWKRVVEQARQRLWRQRQQEQGWRRSSGLSR